VTVTLLAANDLTETWRHDAACRGMDPDLFFPERGEAPAPAVAVCARCPVRDECFAYALAHGEKFGVWGGLPETRRRRLRTALRGQP
jgi:WhiB family redox-sensing transcriptional regulator